MSAMTTEDLKYIFSFGHERWLVEHDAATLEEAADAISDNEHATWWLRRRAADLRLAWVRENEHAGDPAWAMTQREWFNLVGEAQDG